MDSILFICQNKDRFTQSTAEEESVWKVFVASFSPWVFMGRDLNLPSLFFLQKSLLAKSFVFELSVAVFCGKQYVLGMGRVNFSPLGSGFGFFDFARVGSRVL